MPSIRGAQPVHARHLKGVLKGTRGGNVALEPEILRLQPGSNFSGVHFAGNAEHCLESIEPERGSELVSNEDMRRDLGRSRAARVR